MLIDIKIKKKSVAVFGQNSRLKIYADPKQFTSIQAFQVHFPKMARYIWLKFCFEY